MSALQRRRAGRLSADAARFSRARATAPYGCAAFYWIQGEGMSRSLCCEARVCWGVVADTRPHCEGCWSPVAVHSAPPALRGLRWGLPAVWADAVRPALDLYEAHRRAGREVPRAA